MTALTFSVLDIVAEPYTVAPQLTARLRIEESSDTVIHAIALRCQVRIEPQRRSYSDAEAEGLLGLFGGRSRWRDTLRPSCGCSATRRCRDSAEWRSWIWPCHAPTTSR